MSAQPPPGPVGAGTAPGRVTVLPAGEEALLLEVGSLAQVLTLAGVLREAVDRGDPPWAGVTDVVPGARTVLLHTRPGTDLAPMRAAAGHLDAGHPASGPPIPVTEGVVEVPLVYDGPDLHLVASLTGLTPAGVVAAHTGRAWHVAFGGFAPGFAYLAGGDPRLDVPRRDAPRPSVAAGSVGLAGGLCGVYPRASPGGWQVIGTTDLALWDVDRDPPALLTPGTSVRFIDVGGWR